MSQQPQPQMWTASTTEPESSGSARLPRLVRSTTSSLRVPGTSMLSSTRLRARSLVQGEACSSSSTSYAALSPINTGPVASSSRLLPTIPASPLFTEQDADSETTTDESSPPVTPSEEHADHDAVRIHSDYASVDSRLRRMRSSSLNHYVPFATPPRSGSSKGKAVARIVPEAANWTSIPILPTPTLEGHDPLANRAVSGQTAYDIANAPLLGRRATFSHSSTALPAALGAISAPAVTPGTSVGVRSLLQPIALLFGIFALSTCVVVVLISTIPNLSLPHSIAQVLEQANSLRIYSASSYTASFHILSVLTVMFVWKQAFSSAY